MLGAAMVMVEHPLLLFPRKRDSQRNFPVRKGLL
jgi:hypothetical protein